MASLDSLRRKIDNLDDELLGLLNERASLAENIGRIKAQNGTDVLSSDRERAILDRLSEKNNGPITSESLEDIFQTIFTTCRSIQKRVSVAYFGPESTYTHQAAINHFGRNA